MANHVAASARQLSESVAANSPLAQVISLRTVTPARALKTAEIVARTLRRLIVDGELKDGDFLPTEAELVNQFSVGRATLREAVRLLESDGLIEVRRGSRSGARVRIPGAEIVARPAGMLLQLAGATLDDVMAAREAIEPAAAKWLARQGTTAAFDELRAILADEFPSAWKSGRLAEAAATFHRRLVELTDNATLSLIAGMLQEITERHTAETLRRRRNLPKAHFERLMVSYNRLIDLLLDGDGDGAEAHWRRHLDTTREVLLHGLGAVKVRDLAM
jgi:GntR family transcriptional repressor for pyruvate dehydrogenase complex